MFSALLYLRLASLKNRIGYHLRRLRNPKYVFGAIVGAGYIYFILFHRFASAISQGGKGAIEGSRAATFLALRPHLLVLGGAFLLAIVAGRFAWAWIAPLERTALNFSEAEIAFFFPAPMSRRRLIDYHLVSAQLRILLSSLLLALFSTRWGMPGGNMAIRAVGWWVLLSTFNLHSTAVKLTAARLTESSVRPAWRRAGALAAIGLLAAAVVSLAWSHSRAPTPEDFRGGRAIAAYLDRVLNQGWLHWLLWPFEAVLSPILAPDGRVLAGALGPAMLVLAAHYAWVVRLEAPFEDRAIALAEKRARLRAARLAGGGRFDSPPPRARREPFPLASGGRPEIAFLWKNLLSMRSVLNWRLLPIAALVISQLVVFSKLSATRGHDAHIDFSPLIVVAAAIVAGYVLLVGPQYARQDLRSDLPNTDMLKTYPLSGWQVVLGELLAPTAILTSVLWLALLAAAIAFNPTGLGPWATPGVRVTIAACLFFLCPALCLLQIVVPNAAMLLFPAWHQATRARTGGIEALGQRLIFYLGQHFILILAVLPAILACSLVVFASAWILGLVAAAILGAAAALAVLAGELTVGLWWLGRRFDKFDLAGEIRS